MVKKILNELLEFHFTAAILKIKLSNIDWIILNRDLFRPLNNDYLDILYIFVYYLHFQISHKWIEIATYIQLMTIIVNLEERTWEITHSNSIITY